MVYRPTSVTVICWLLIAFSVLGLFGAIFTVFNSDENVQKIMAQSPLPIAVQEGLMFGGVATQLVCSIFMLRGHNWARILFVTWSAIGLCIGLATSPYKAAMFPGAIMFAIESFFLFRPAANAFFANEGANIDPASVPSNRRIAGVAFYVLAGFLFVCMGTPTLMATPSPGIKVIMLCFFLLPFAICLAIGRWLSAGNWKLDVGYVFVFGALGGGSIALMMATMFSRPEFQQNFPPDQAKHMQEMFTDYTFAVVWFVAWLVLGAALIVLGRRPPKAAQFPPIAGG